MLNQKKWILVLTPHTDDGEFGCGEQYPNLYEKGTMFITQHFQLVNNRFYLNFHQIF